MSTLPTKRDPADTTPPPSWRDLVQRFAAVLRDFLKDFVAEGKELERDLEPRLLPALKRLKAEIEKLIGRLEQRATKPPASSSKPPAAS